MKTYNEAQNLKDDISNQHLKSNINVRLKRQTDFENDEAGSTTEKLLVDPPEGWGLAEVLGIDRI